MSSRVCPRRGGCSRPRADSASSKCRYRAGARCPERRQRDRAGFGASTLGVGRGFRRWVWSASTQLPTTTIRVATHRNMYPGVDDAAASCAADLHEVDRRPQVATSVLILDPPQEHMTVRFSQGAGVSHTAGSEPPLRGQTLADAALAGAIPLRNARGVRLSEVEDQKHRRQPRRGTVPISGDIVGYDRERS
jgi:hypothetical protein